MDSNNKPLHYGWSIVGLGTLCIMASLGFGRFALGMLLPSMAGPLNLTYSQMGFISTANFVGYLVAVLAGGFLTPVLGPRKLIFYSLLLVGGSMLLVGMARGATTIAVLYTLTGIGSGGSNIPMMAMVSAWFSRGIRGRAAGFIVIGSGFAIIISGKLIPFINQLAGTGGWRISWFVLGGAVLAIAVLCLRFLVDKPADMGLEPVGAQDSPARSFAGKKSIYREMSLYHLGSIYFLFGYTYVIYATFFVTALVQEWGYTEATAGNYWAWVGVLSLLSGPVFGTLSDRLGRRAGLMLVFAFQAAAYILVAARLPGAFLYMSVGFYGVVAWSIPSIMAAASGDYFGAARAPQAFGIITFIFALGQIAGPAVAGMLAEATGSFSASFMMASALAVLAVGLTAVLRKPPGDVPLIKVADNP